ncbi:MAG: UDP-N-acetylmuramyl-tripeptide synthetase [Patescibacteria group bacterium]
MSPKSFIRSITPDVILSAYHLTLAFCAALWYRFPSERMIVVGVTGTKGKSSTIFMLAKILEGAGHKVAVASSLMFKIGEHEWLNPHHMTMAGRFRLQQFLAQAAAAGCTHALIETTSEGIKQHRHRFINFDGAVCTNLSPEHIEAHGGFENYKRAKGELFRVLMRGARKTFKGTAQEKIMICNTDDEHAEYFLSFPADKKYAYSARGSCAGAPTGVLCLAAAAAADAAGTQFTVDKTVFRLKLPGAFNVANALCAVVVAQSLGVSLAIAKDALAQIEEIPGRFQFIRVGQKFTAIIDLAHTPPSFTEVLSLAKTLRPDDHGRLIAMFGSAGGGRDAWKRPELGRIAAQHANYIVLTNEDPYDEKPEDILDAIQRGVTEAGFSGVLEVIANRRLAIRRAVNVARYNDVVVFLGKGTEQTMVTGGVSSPWNEEEVVIAEIRSMLYDRQ